MTAIHKSDMGAKLSVSFSDNSTTPKILMAGIVSAVTAAGLQVPVPAAFPTPVVAARPLQGSQRSLAVLHLTQPMERGLMLQQSVRTALAEFQASGLISTFEEVGMDADSVTYQAYMPLARWNMANRDQIHDVALRLQDEFRVAVIIDLQRERLRARSS